MREGKGKEPGGGKEEQKEINRSSGVAYDESLAKY